MAFPVSDPEYGHLVPMVFIVQEMLLHESNICNAKELGEKVFLQTTSACRDGTEKSTAQKQGRDYYTKEG